jgi:hypothetical protein
MLPICEACFDSPNSGDTVARKVLNAPDMEISEGGEVGSMETVYEIADAIAEKDGTTSH